MMRALVICGLVLLLLSALTLVFVRHQGRLAFVALQTLSAQRDGLDEQWSKLLLEQATWSGRRIAQKAHTELALQSPAQNNIRYIIVAPQPTPQALANRTTPGKR